MRCLIVVTIATLLTSAASTQPLKIQDRHPDMVHEPLPTRSVTTEAIHTFEQRWEPVLELLRRQRAAGLAPPLENVPARPVAPAMDLPAREKQLVPKARTADRAKAGDVCFRHGMVKMMVDKYRWRCRR